MLPLLAACLLPPPKPPTPPPWNAKRRLNFGAVSEKKLLLDNQTWSALASGVGEDLNLPSSRRQGLMLLSVFFQRLFLIHWRNTSTFLIQP